jgi:hypothetical protein
MEGSCKFLYDLIQPYIDHSTTSRVRIKKIQIWEHENNSASYEP